MNKKVIIIASSIISFILGIITGQLFSAPALFVITIGLLIIAIIACCVFALYVYFKERERKAKYKFDTPPAYNIRQSVHTPNVRNGSGVDGSVPDFDKQ